MWSVSVAGASSKQGWITLAPCIFSFVAPVGNLARQSWGLVHYQERVPGSGFRSDETTPRRSTAPGSRGVGGKLEKMLGKWLSWADEVGMLPSRCPDSWTPEPSIGGGYPRKAQPPPSRCKLI